MDNESSDDAPETSRALDSGEHGLYFTRTLIKDLLK
jgi:hypothetical protein